MAKGYILTGQTKAAQEWIRQMGDFKDHRTITISGLTIAYAQIGDIETAKRLFDQQVKLTIEERDKSTISRDYLDVLKDYESLYNPPEPKAKGIYEPFFFEPETDIERQVVHMALEALISLPKGRDIALNLFEEALALAKTIEDYRRDFQIGAIVNAMNDVGFHNRALEILITDIKLERHLWESSMIDYFVHQHDYATVRRLVEDYDFRYTGDNKEDILDFIAEEDGIDRALEIQKLFGFETGKDYLGKRAIKDGNFVQGFRWLEETYLMIWVKHILQLLPTFGRYSPNLDRRILRELIDQAVPLMPQVKQLSRYL
jgi:tetratricopeptide (TPR) repeat protein